MQTSSQPLPPPLPQDEWLIEFLNNKTIICNKCKQLVVHTTGITVERTAKRNICQLCCPYCPVPPRKRGRVYFCASCSKYTTRRMSDVKCVCVNLESDNNLSHNLSTSTQENNDTISEAPLPLEDNRNDDNNTIIESNSPLKEDGYESSISYHDMNVDSSESDSKSAATASDSGHTVN
eukprot:scaffold96238_cov31-Cyclotella_meneghiniana.AAC.1